MRRHRILALALLLVSLSASAQVQEHNNPLSIISNRPKPNVLMLIDTSGSMLWDSLRVNGNDITVRKENHNGTVDELLYANPIYSFSSDAMKCFLDDSDNPRSRIGQAKEALREIVSQIEDINVGIGRFEKTLTLNRFRTMLPSDLNQVSAQYSQYTYTYNDGQTPNIGQINIPYSRRHNGTGQVTYPFCRIVRSPGDVFWSWDPTDTIWNTSTSNTISYGGYSYIRMNWSYNKVEDSRFEMFRPLTAAGDFIYRGTYSSPNTTHRNKLNQVDSFDVFLSDADFLQLKANSGLGDTLSIERTVDSVYGVPINRTFTLYYHPTTADYDTSTSCGSGQILVGIQDEFLDDFDTPDEDESDNKEEVLATAGPISTNAKVYDFTVEPAVLTKLGPYFGMGGTPLGTTLEAGKNYFESTVIPRDQGYTVDHCRENFVILLTDGYETCGGNPESVAQDLYNNLGIKVYVLAFCTTTTQADAIAAAGGTDTAFRAENRDELIDALKSIFAEIKTSVELAAPVAASSSTSATSMVEGNIALLPFFDFPGFTGRLQARKLFKNCVVEVDPKTGAIVTDGSGNPVIIEDDIDEQRIEELVNDPNDPIERDPSREIVGLQLDPPTFLWEAGELVSQSFIESEDPEREYPYLKVDSGDIDGDGNTTEEIVNPAFKSADERQIYTTLEYGAQPEVIGFTSADLLDDSDNRDAAINLFGIDGWSEREKRFLIEYTRGKVVRRFPVTTELYGHTFNPGDPVPDPDSDDDNGDGVPDGYLFKQRIWKLGDIVSGTPVVVGPPMGTYPIAVNDNDNSLNDFDEFAEAHIDTPHVVIIGSNDGMLHAFALRGIDLNDDGDFDDSDEYYPGEEIWAFVLPDAMSKLRELYYDSPDDDDFDPDGQKLTPHQYFIDGPMTLAIVRARVHEGDTDGDGKSTDPEFRMMLFFGEGRGGHRYWAFDVTDPLSPKPVWSLTHSRMGMTISRPAVGPVKVGPSAELDNDDFKYFAFMGSGFEFGQTDGNATIGNVAYQVDINNGTIVDYFDAGDEAGGAGIPNAVVGRAIMVDDNEDFFIERVYFGDLDGNIWRWRLTDDTVVDILASGAEPLTSADERLERPILDSLTYANIFGFHVITAATGGDTRRYLDENKYRINYPQQRVYMIVDTDREGNIVSLLNGIINDNNEYEESGSTVGVDLRNYRVAENIPVVTAFTEYDESGKIYRGFQTFYPLYIPDPAGLRTIRCSFGSSELLILDSIFSESNIVESTQGTVIDMGEGKATGITYVGGNILFSIGDQFKVYGEGIYRFESNLQVKARLKVLSWREVF
jgi:hypothetical protein